MIKAWVDISNIFVPGPPQNLQSNKQVALQEPVDFSKIQKAMMLDPKEQKKAERREAPTILEDDEGMDMDMEEGIQFWVAKITSGVFIFTIS